MNFHTVDRNRQVSRRNTQPFSQQYKPGIEVHILSKPIKSLRPHKPPSNSLEEMNNASENVSVGNSVPNSTTRPLHRKHSRSQPTLNKVDSNDVRASSFFSDYSSKPTDAAYPSSLIKYSYDHVMNESGPIPVQIPVVPSMPHNYSKTPESNSPQSIKASVLVPQEHVVSLNSTMSSERLSSHAGVSHSTNLDSQTLPSTPLVDKQFAKTSLSLTPGSHKGESLLDMQTSTHNIISTPSSNQLTYHKSNILLSSQQYTHSSSSLARHSIAAPIPIKTPTVPPFKRISVHDSHLQSTSSQQYGDKHTSDATSNVVPVHSNVNNIHSTSTQYTTSHQAIPNEAYRGRSLSYSGVDPMPSPYRTRFMSQTSRPLLTVPSTAALPIVPRISSQQGMYEHSSSSEDENDVDNAFITPRKTDSTVSKHDFPKKPNRFVVNKETEWKPRSLSILLSTSTSLPLLVRIVKGTLYPSGGVAITKGHDLLLHFVKHTNAFAVQGLDGVKYTIPFNSSIKFAVLYNPSNPAKLMTKGFRFRSAGDIMKLKSIPLVVAATQSYNGGSSKATVREGQILLIRGIKTDSVNGYRLMAKTVNGHKKLLPANCVAHFTTAPNLVSLTLPELIKCRVKMPQHVALQYPASVHQNRSLPSVVTVLEPTKSVSVIATCPSLNAGPTSKLLEIPLSSSVIVQDTGKTDDKSKIFTEKLYTTFDACVTSYCSDSQRSTVQEVQSTFLKCLSSSERSFGWELVPFADTTIEKEKLNPLLATPLSAKNAQPLSRRYSQSDSPDVEAPTGSLPSLPASTSHPLSFDSTSSVPSVPSSECNSPVNHLSTSQPMTANINPLSQPSHSPKIPSPEVESKMDIQYKHSETSTLTQATPAATCVERESVSNTLESKPSKVDITRLHPDELIRQIQTLEAKCTSTDKQLSEFSKQFTEVKSVLTSLQQSVAPSDTNSALTAALLEGNIETHQSQQDSFHPGIGENVQSKATFHSSQDVTLLSSNGVLNSENEVEPALEKSDRPKTRSYFSKRLNQAKTRFGKLRSKKQLAPISPPSIPVPATTLHYMKSIPEVFDSEAGDFKDTTSYVNKSELEGLADESKSSIAVTSRNTTHLVTRKPPIQPKPPSLKKKFKESKVMKVDEVRVNSSKKFSTDNTSQNSGSVRKDQKATPVENLHYAKLEIKKQDNELSDGNGEASVLVSEQQSSLDKSNKEFTVHQTQQHPLQKPPLAPKPKQVVSKATPNERGMDVKTICNADIIHDAASEQDMQKGVSLKRMSDSTKHKIRETDDPVVTTHSVKDTSAINAALQDEDEIAALVDDINAWCSQIETEVSQLTLMQTEC